MDSSSYLTAVALGVGAHLIFQTFNPDFHLLPLLLVYFGGLGVLVWILKQFAPSILSALLHAGILNSVFTLAFTTSLIVYRLFFHRLHNFPGPLQARLSRLYLVARTYRSLQLHVELERLHQRYGDFVRTGPREVSILRPSAIPAIYSRNSRCRKSLWYAHVSDNPRQVSLHMGRDPKIHHLRRKIWDKALNMKGDDTAKLAYESAIVQKAASMVQQIRRLMRKDGSVDAAHWSSLFASDVMGIVGFGDDFHQVDCGQEHPAIANLHQSMEFLGRWTPTPWVIGLLASLPRAAKKHSSFLNHTSRLVEAKLKDILSWLISAMKDNDPGKPPTIEALHEDGRSDSSRSDTLSSTLAHALYYLTAYPNEYKKLQQALYNHLTRANGTTEWSTLGSISYLDAIIQETLRLRPAAPSGQPRVTPPEGIQIDEVWVPGNVNVVVPQHVLHRDERFFPRGEEFLPQRWVDGDVSRDAFFPFGSGPRACVGKRLAMVELRIILAHIALNFDLEFADEKAAKAFITQGKDTVTYTVPPLPLYFHDRKM
ncbi:benzoate 4-monooxygenase cytochrome P450 [Aspergillus niger]|uniref:Benzoate 4-monooxygenase cytochrome P450 n=1 Tax=Aspergillus niger TaxID=5061 RepID=A0A100IJQ9_ASPNG|nr:benzoate 4-monooxygenase cytochrome P450 [Aspergillus niger]